MRPDDDSGRRPTAPRVGRRSPPEVALRDFQIHRTQSFANPLREVFAFFSDPANLTRITPDWLRFNIISPQPVIMAEGTLIDYTLRVHGIPLTWRSEITAWNPPYRFVDEQRKGPYRYWIHEHLLADRNGVTEVTDRVHYAVPGGAIVQRLFVARDVAKIFDYRRAVLAEIFTEAAAVPAEDTT
jgi:ligand-binding SRPBCC domain-containing protein